MSIDQAIPELAGIPGHSISMQFRNSKTELNLYFYCNDQLNMNTSAYAGIGRNSVKFDGMGRNWMSGIPELNDDEFDGLARCRNV